MTYLDLARSAVRHREQREKRPSTTAFSQSESRLGCERSEGSEKSPAADPDWMTPEEAEELKAQIIATVTVEPANFDRARYEALLVRWNAYEMAMARSSEENQVA